MKIQLKKRYKPIVYGLTVFCALYFLAINSLEAQEKKSKKNKLDIEVQVNLGASYDDNILKYSDKYLDRFLNGEDEGRFHIDTYDDMIFLTALQLTSTHKFFGKNKTVFDVDAAQRTYLVNNVKNWNNFSVGIRQYMPNRISFKFSYSYIPEFYVRHFRDEVWVDEYGYVPISFQPYAFSKDDYDFWIQKYFFKGTRLKFSISHALYFHNEHYTEYDSKDMYYGMYIYQQVLKNLRLEFNYMYVTSDAKGYDAAYETLENTNGPNATFEEDRITAGLFWKLPKLQKKKQDFSAKIAFLNRYYQSPHPVEIDELHAGRVDKNIRMYFNYQITLNKSMKLEAFYNWYFRDTETTSDINREFVSDEKDYLQNTVGIEFTYDFKL
ncbi:MAG: hypothetical protein K9G76_02875 [Bacteroidales bacterium]|nr:hypothetical protein [Bacteroidales bacterium]MCF8402737.1 hypothetical protein [Bacteroidales bacterium]